jgi:hypothetical protein
VGDLQDERRVDSGAIGDEGGIHLADDPAKGLIFLSSLGKQSMNLSFACVLAGSRSDGTGATDPMSKTT